MECRLCLCSVSEQSSVSINCDVYPLVQRIQTCCKLQIDEDDNLPEVICISCAHTLESLFRFRNVCIESDKTQNLNLSDCLNIKTEEVILDDLILKDEVIVDTNISNIHDKIVKNVKPHTGEKLFKCEICFKSLASEFYKMKHMKIHTETDPFECDFCGKTYRFKSRFIKHVITHNGIKVHTCKFCHKSFTRKSSFTNHEKSHTRVNVFECNTCFKSFSTKFSLERHKKSRCVVIKPHRCKMCAKAFTNETYCGHHKKLHSEKKRYECSWCFKILSTKWNLVKHTKLHSAVENL